MEKELLKKVASMMMSNEKELSQLGNTILYGSSPSLKDINTINKIFMGNYHSKKPRSFYMKIFGSRDTLAQVKSQEIDLSKIGLTNKVATVDIFSIKENK